MTSGFSGRLAAELASALYDAGVNLGPSLAAVSARVERLVLSEVAAIVTNPKESSKAEADAKAYVDAIAKAEAAAKSQAAAEALKNSQATKIEQLRAALQSAVAALGGITST